QWDVETSGSTVVIDYTLFGDRADGTYDAIDPTHAHLNPPATFAWARGFEKRPVSLKIEIPQGSNWTVATQLASGADGILTAPNLDALMDAPLEIGPHTLQDWTSDGARFRLALHAQAPDDAVMRFQKMCEAVVLEEEGVFGAFPKYDNGSYTFLVDDLPYVSGDGMEHRDSTVITSARALTRESAGQQIESVAHEFFHSWNVKRIRPRSLEPFDYERVNMSGELWFAEGFTDYYAPLVLNRAGLISRDEFMRVMGNAIDTVVTAPGREVFSAVEMSRQAAFVDGAASLDPENRANTYISYYTYGRAIALGIDLAIRSQFPGKSLDDWMRAMWRSHPDVQKPYTERDLEQALAEATGSGKFAREMFQRHIEGKEPMEYGALLANAGFLLQPASPARAWIGNPIMSFSDRGIDITGPTLSGSPLYLAGIDRGDRILEFKTRREWDDLVASHKPGDRSILAVEGRT
ncbi:MAG: M61 family metallopeptidase, partial [Bryobacteraceae bacterium]